MPGQNKEITTGSKATHHNASTGSPNVVQLAVNVSDGVFRWRHLLQTSDGVTVWILELFGEVRAKKSGEDVIENNEPGNVLRTMISPLLDGLGPHRY